MLLDIALDLLVREGEPAITIGAVAERSGVTRTLVYKHFENRDDLIVELYRRESKRLDDELVAAVVGASGGFEQELRAMVRGLLDATDRWGTIFNPLRHTAAGSAGRRELRARNRRTVEYFAGHAVRDLGVPADRAERATRILLGGLDPLMWMVRPDMGDAEREALVDLYVGMALDALHGLSR